MESISDSKVSPSSVCGGFGDCLVSDVGTTNRKEREKLDSDSVALLKCSRFKICYNGFIHNYTKQFLCFRNKVILPLFNTR